MSYTYASFKTAIATELAVSETDADFVAIFPTLIDDAEQRIYRDLDLLTALMTISATVTANTRFFTLPISSGHVLTVPSINIFNASSVRTSLTPVAREVVDFLWPSELAASATTVPQMFARIDDLRVLFGPPPGASFAAEVIATIRPAALSASETTTFTSLYLSDLLFAAAMVSAAGFMRNYGAQADDPKMAVSWEMQYEMRLASAKAEEARKKYAAMPPMPGGK